MCVPVNLFVRFWFIIMVYNYLCYYHLSIIFMYSCQICWMIRHNMGFIHLTEEITPEILNPKPPANAYKTPEILNPKPRPIRINAGNIPNLMKSPSGPYRHTRARAGLLILWAQELGGCWILHTGRSPNFARVFYLGERDRSICVAHGHCSVHQSILTPLQTTVTVHVQTF